MAAECSACHRPILWAVTVNGRMMPLDFAPDPEGNQRLDGTVRVGAGGRSGPGVVSIGPPSLLDEPDGADRYMPHHATCPNVERFRNKR